MYGDVQVTDGSKGVLMLTSPRALVSAGTAAGLAVSFAVGLGTAAGSSADSRTPATQRGLPVVSSGHRPGPDILYAPPARAPQLENTGVWHAPPMLHLSASFARWPTSRL